MINFKQRIFNKDPLANIHYIDRYVKIISKIQPSADNENHHVLPVSIFPEFVKDPNNIITVPTHWHYLLHWVLIKIFSNKTYNHKMSFAFNNMKRVIQSKQKKGALYAMSRKYISEAVRFANTGKKHTIEFRTDVGERMTNSMVVRDNEGNQFRASINDPKVLSGEWVFYRQGYSHTEYTKKSMSENSGIKGKIPCYNSQNVVKYFYKNEIPDGWSEGNIAHIGSKRSSLAREKMSIAWTKRKDVICPFCNKISKNVGNMNRYHFDNCKHKPIIGE